MNEIYYLSGIIFIIFLMLLERRARVRLMNNCDRKISKNYWLFVNSWCNRVCRKNCVN